MLLSLDDTKKIQIIFLNLMKYFCFHCALMLQCVFFMANPIILQLPRRAKKLQVTLSCRKPDVIYTYAPAYMCNIHILNVYLTLITHTSIYISNMFCPSLKTSLCPLTREGTRLVLVRFLKDYSRFLSRERFTAPLISWRADVWTGAFSETRACAGRNTDSQNSLRHYVPAMAGGPYLSLAHWTVKRGRNLRRPCEEERQRRRVSSRLAATVFSDVLIRLTSGPCL
jgi:hypothetical protein